jgi:uncharacterized protein YbcV (DUF1398 family)
MTLNEKKIKEIGQKSKAERWDYPKVFSAYQEAGVESYEVKISDFHFLFFGSGQSFRELPPADLEPLHPAKIFDIEKLKETLKASREKTIDYWEFARRIAAAGVASYRVDMAKRTVTYHGGNADDAYSERVPEL